MAQFRRNRPGQVVALEIQHLESSQMAQHGWDRPDQPVVARSQTGDPSAAIGLHPGPLRERRGAQPVGIVAPVRPARGEIERLQHLPVRHRLGPRIDDGHGGRVRCAGGNSGRQRSTEPKRDRLVMVHEGVLDRHDDEGCLNCRSCDGDALRHPRKVCGGGPIAGYGRQRDLR